MLMPDVSGRGKPILIYYEKIKKLRDGDVIFYCLNKLSPHDQMAAQGPLEGHGDWRVGS